MAIRYDDVNTKAARKIIPGFRTKRPGTRTLRLVREMPVTRLRTQGELPMAGSRRDSRGVDESRQTPVQADAQNESWCDLPGKDRSPAGRSAGQRASDPPERRSLGCHRGWPTMDRRSDANTARCVHSHRACVA